MFFPQLLWDSWRRHCEKSQNSMISFFGDQHPLKLLNIVDQKLPKATGQHVLSLLVAPLVGYQDLALESLAHSIAYVSGFPPFALDIVVGLISDDLLFCELGDLGVQEGFGVGHGDLFFK